jgi:hypothetical protein
MELARRRQLELSITMAGTKFSARLPYLLFTSSASRPTSTYVPPKKIVRFTLGQVNYKTVEK